MGTEWTKGEGGDFIPDLIQPLRAYRFWIGSSSTGGSLKSIMHSYKWDVVNEAVCESQLFWSGDLTRGHDSKAPQEKCSCGFYGYHLPVSAFGDSGGFGGTGNVFGVFESFGDVILHPLGLRAQKTRILALAPNYSNWDMTRAELRDVIDSYGERGVRVFSDTDSLIAAYPPEDLSNIVGKSAEELRLEYRESKQ